MTYLVFDMFQKLFFLEREFSSKSVLISGFIFVLSGLPGTGVLTGLGGGL